MAAIERIEAIGQGEPVEAIGAVQPVERIALPHGADPAALWARAALEVRRWLAARALAERDAIVLAPFAALLAPLRAAFGARAGWQPRVETALTLADALGPPPVALEGGCTGDPVLDRLTALRLLRRAGTDGSMTGASPGLDGAPSPDLSTLAALLVDAAQQLRRAALARAPAERALFWAAARARIEPLAAQPGTEATLLRLAFDWAAGASAGAATDALFALRPSALIVVGLGGGEPVASGWLQHTSVPRLLLDADPPAAAPFADVAAPARLRRLRCADAEAEAEAAAAEVIEALNAGRTPVALVALDRERVRRVRALLERAGVPLLDETGWTLSTTRAAARVAGLLRAALPGAGRDALLDWLGTWPPASTVRGRQALDALEADWRGRRARPGDAAAGQALWQEAGRHLAPLQAGGARSLADWLTVLRARLAADGSLGELAGDAAGVQVLKALRIEAADAPGTSGGTPASPAWRAASTALVLDLAEFSAWVEAALEASSFVPPPGAGAAVVVTPLLRAIGRPFGQAVVPGADHRHLGAPAVPPSLIAPALAAALGLEDADALRTRQRQAIAHLLRLPAVSFVRREQDAGEALGDSPDLLWLLAERARRGLPPWPAAAAQWPHAEIRITPLAAPLPRAPSALPARLSATQVAALRDCPYRFFARAVLRLDEPAELEAALAKRDYGDWLHLVLWYFHRDAEGAGGADDGTHRERVPASGDARSDERDDRREARLERAAERATAELGLDAAELLPFRASFEDLAPRYLDWLAKREAQGWHWQGGEVEHRAEPAALAPTVLAGRIDRIDRDAGGRVQLLDYKTGSAEGFRRQVREPLEDTQLAFYAALLAADAPPEKSAAAPPPLPPPLHAAYLALDDKHGPLEIVHPDVERSAAALVQGLGAELARLRAGAALPALGEGRVCELCEARGLCRRDHWTRP